jgi:hypothetical protein
MQFSGRVLAQQVQRPKKEKNQKVDPENQIYILYVGET